jgi:hypothetical protein
MKAGKLANAFAALEPEDGARQRRPSRSRRTSSPATPADAATQAPGGANGALAAAATHGEPQHGEAAGEPGGQDPDAGDWQPMVPRHSRHRSSSTGGSTGNLLSQLSAGSEALLAAADVVKAESEGQQRLGAAPAASPPPPTPSSPAPCQRVAEHTASLEACQAATRQVRPDEGGGACNFQPCSVFIRSCLRPAQTERAADLAHPHASDASCDAWRVVCTHVDSQAQAELAAAQLAAAAAERAWRSATQAVDAAQGRLSASLEAEGRAGGHTPPGRGAAKGGVKAGGSARGSDASGGAAARRGDAGDAVPGGAAGQVAALGEELAVLRVKIADQGTQVQRLRAAAAAAGAGGQDAGHGRRHVAHGGAAAGGEAGQKTKSRGGGEHGQGRAAAGLPAGTPRKEGAVAAQLPGAGAGGSDVGGATPAAEAAVLDTRPPDAPPPTPATAAPAAAPASLPPVAVPPASSESPHPGTPSHAAGGVGTPSSGRRGWSTSRGDTPGGSGGGGGPGEGSVDPTPAEALAALKRRTPTSSKAE